MVIRAFQTPNMDVVFVEQMASIRVLNGGVGIFDSRKRMIGWIEVVDPAQILHTTSLMVQIINEPRRAKTPDWGYLTEIEDAPTPASALAPQPKRNTGTGAGAGSNS